MEAASNAFRESLGRDRFISVMTIWSGLASHSMLVLCRYDDFDRRDWARRSGSGRLYSRRKAALTEPASGLRHPVTILARRLDGAANGEVRVAYRAVLRRLVAGCGSFPVIGQAPSIASLIGWKRVDYWFGKCDIHWMEMDAETNAIA